MKLGLLFSGQGSQKPGMGLDFLSDPLFESIISEGSAATGLDLKKIMASENGELNETKNVQPALVAVSYGIYKMLQRDLPNMPIAAMTGLSLGEYAALMASEAINAEEGLKLLADRGQYMQEDADATPSTMAAILDPDIAVVEATCDKYDQVWIANYNSPKQLVIGGVAEDVNQAVADIKEQEAAKRAVLLNVSGAFHTPLFNGARAKMHDRLANQPFFQPVVPVISNTTIDQFKGEEIASIMERQLAVPTHFGEDVEYMVENQGVDATLEIGPGKTLSKFAKQVNSSLSRANIGTMAEYEAYVKENQQWI
ncbi:MAG: ACP S-malonyltransferase [Limosilactobacillus sp.]|uniref:ACP S-malonyltransferase n=1 Tax=Limosilactobacillus sp. TaxID=2773925 RepID=UPI0026F51EFA|nr:ACP S-malonyltransferase [Limosilactobacillus sp.]